MAPQQDRPAGGAAARLPFEMAEKVASAFGDDVEVYPASFDMPVVKVRPGALRAVAQFLKDEGYAMLLDVGGVDYLGRRPAEERYEVVYHLLDLQRLRRIRLRVALPESNPEVPSLSDLWPSANWAEREVFDLFGVRFTGHPKLERILMPDGWQGHPLRKDYPLRGPARSGRPQALQGRFFPLRLDSAAAPGDQAPSRPGGGSAVRADGRESKKDGRA